MDRAYFGSTQTLQVTDQAPFFQAPYVATRAKLVLALWDVLLHFQEGRYKGRTQKVWSSRDPYIAELPLYMSSREIQTF